MGRGGGGAGGSSAAGSAGGGGRACPGVGGQCGGRGLGGPARALGQASGVGCLRQLAGQGFVLGGEAGGILAQGLQPGFGGFPAFLQHLQFGIGVAVLCPGRHARGQRDADQDQAAGMAKGCFSSPHGDPFPLPRREPAGSRRSLPRAAEFPSGAARSGPGPPADRAAAPCRPGR